jgi:hypothetical protein
MEFQFFVVNTCMYFQKNESYSSALCLLIEVLSVDELTLAAQSDVMPHANEIMVLTMKAG